MTFAYSVVFSDPGHLEAANESLIVRDLDAALADWSRYINGIGTLIVQVNIVSTTVGRADGAPTAATSIGVTTSGATLVAGSAYYELTHGTHLAASDITIDLDPAYIATLFLNPSPGTGTVPSNEIDAVSVFRHELEHGFGMSGYHGNDGNLAYGGAYLTAYDTFIQFAPDGNATFVGPTAMAAYGGPLPLTSFSTTQNYYHLADAATDPLGQDLMNGVAYYYGGQYQISNVDIAILRDLGYSITSGTNGPLACFLAGSRVRTPTGMVAVEALREGDAVFVLEDGTPSVRAIAWIGQRRIDAHRMPNPNGALPIRVVAEAFGTGTPCRDLLLSPDHAVHVDGVLIPVRHLVNGATVRQERRIARPHYFHVELERHGVLLAEDLPVESYLDTGNRAMFANAGVGLLLHPDFSVRLGLKPRCAPLAEAGAVVRAMRRRLFERALRRTGAVVTTAPEFAVFRGERALRPIVTRGSLFRFVLPEQGGPIRIVTSVGVPAHTDPDSEDWRPIGVAVSRMVLHGPAGRREIAMDDPLFDAPGASGWFGPERRGTEVWRWTSAEATLPRVEGSMLDLALGGGWGRWATDEGNGGQQVSVA